MACMCRTHVGQRSARKHDRQLHTHMQVQSVLVLAAVGQQTEQRCK